MTEDQDMVAWYKCLLPPPVTDLVLMRSLDAPPPGIDSDTHVEMAIALRSDFEISAGALASYQAGLWSRRLHPAADSSQEEQFGKPEPGGQRYG